jgi:hypothetical protein
MLSMSQILISCTHKELKSELLVTTAKVFSDGSFTFTPPHNINLTQSAWAGKKCIQGAVATGYL